MKRTPLTRKTPLKPGKGLSRTTPLRPRSSKMAARYRVRGPLVAELLAKPSICEVPWCTALATDPHEPLTRARGGSIVDPDNIRLICRPHHSEIHDKEPDWAYEHGFLFHFWEATP